MMMDRMGNKIVCSVVMPCYNAKNYIGKSIESVLAQTFSSWELIIVDDGSSDGSAEYIKKKFVDRDSRIKLECFDRNLGAAEARNRAIELASGRFIAFLDSDDLWTSDKLKAQLDFMVTHRYAFSYTGYCRVDKYGSFLNDVGVPDSIEYRELLKANVIGCLTAIYDTEELGKVYMPLIRKRQDFGLWLRLLRLTPRAYGLNRNLAYYTVRDDSISSNKNDAAQYTWKLYRDVEQLSLPKSIYYFAHYAVRGVVRTKFPNIANRLGLMFTVER